MISNPWELAGSAGDASVVARVAHGPLTTAAWHREAPRPTGRVSAVAGWSDLDDPAAALNDVLGDRDVASAGLGVVFVSPRHDPGAVASAIAGRFACPVLACTTAGEVAGGYRSGGIAAAAVWGVSARLAAARDVSDFGYVQAARVADELMADGGDASADGEHEAALLAIAGASGGEERVAAHLADVLPAMPLVGGSAGDAAGGAAARVFDGERFIGDAASVVVVRSAAPIEAFATHHFTPSSQRLVVTRSGESPRVVRELNGRPAVEEYCRVTGLPGDEMAPGVAERHLAGLPLMELTPAGWQVRAIRGCGDDGSLLLFSALPVGVVATVGAAGSLAQSLGDELALRDAGRSALMVGFDCVLRRVAAGAASEQEAVARLLSRQPFVGFSTFGEQHAGMHVNHTLSAVLFRSEA